jgi:hypothetical protein
MTDAEVKAYIEDYILPRFSNPEHNFFYETFVTNRVTEAAQELVLDNGADFIKNNSSLDSVVRNDLAELREIGSDIQKRAGTQLAIAIQSGDIASFDIQDFGELSPTEVNKFNALIKKVEVIFTQEASITEGISQIQAIAISTGATPDTGVTISQKIRNLEALKSGFELNSADIISVGLTENQFSGEALETAFEAKHSELIEKAHEL